MRRFNTGCVLDHSKFTTGETVISELTRRKARTLGATVTAETFAGASLVPRLDGAYTNA